MKRIISILTLTAFLCSCITDDIGGEIDGKEDGTALEIPVEFFIESIDMDSVKSSIAASETVVKDINIYAYHKGKLEKAEYFEDVSSFTVSLIRERTYNLYVLSNMGRLTPPNLEKDMLETKFSMGSMSYINGGFPMSWLQNDFQVNGTSPKVGIMLIRLVSRIRLSLDKSEIDNFAVNSVRLCQSAVKMYPFGSDSRAETPSEVGYGDYASAQDLKSINSGGTTNSAPTLR